MDEKHKITIFSIFVAMLLTLGGVGYYYWYNNTYYVSTEDARVSGDFVNITPQISGKLLELNVVEGDTVVKDQIIGRIKAAGIAESNLETTILRAPLSGLIVKKVAAVGEFVSAGSAVAVMVDPAQLYISANIEETRLEKIRTEQLVDIRIDQFDDHDFKGQVQSIGEAANSAFSLLPSSSSGTFTKVVQTVPIKIELDKTSLNLRPATSATVKIHVK